MAADLHIIGERLNGYDQQSGKYNGGDGQRGQARIVDQLLRILVGEPEIRGFHPIGVNDLQEGSRSKQ